MTYNHSRLHCQFNHNQQLLSRSNLENFTLHHWAMNHGFGGWFSSIIICCG